MKLKAAEMLVLLLLLSGKRGPAPGTDNLGTYPLPPNPLDPRNK